MATGIPALFVPPRESGDRTSRRAASPPPRPSSARFRLTCASTSVDASATAWMLFSATLLRFRRAWRRRSTRRRLAHGSPARSAPKHFRLASPTQSTLATEKSNDHDAPLPTLLVPLASRAVRSRPSSRRRTFGSRARAHFLSVCRPHSSTPSRTARPRTHRGVKWRRTRSSAPPDSSRRRVSGKLMWTTPRRREVRGRTCRTIPPLVASPSVHSFGRYSRATTGGCATKSE